ncbi:hypothetical protein COV11_00675 [Candidatus Woesearchaeota archaeon CG10_big_fil_rev_8_21_14_0_10_30_7]|nr:MAG: hypothetical protein COV11_00675 [Candidatus Woesearchaeota archaeon CG10_big_fil_rev_8_21_14_0_10_30_7]
MVKNSVKKIFKNYFKISEIVDESLIYKCTKCGNYNALIKGDVATPCENCQAKGTISKWKKTKQRLFIVTKNINREFEKQKTWVDKMADYITAFCGNMWFVYVHTIWFGWWLWYNLYYPDTFDPFPFGLLTLIVSLEAIYLATFILISQNRQSERAEIRAEMDYRINLETEKDVKEILHILRNRTT